MFEQISGENRLAVSQSPIAEDASEAVPNDVSKFVPVVTPILIAMNVLVFVGMLISGVSAMSPTPWQVVPWGANVGPFTLAGQPWRLFTACFVHFGLIHLGMNMFVLLQVGLLTEKLFGRVRFILLYMLAGLGGSLLSLYIHPFAVSAGASGAIFGLYGGLLGFLLVERKAFPSSVAAQLALRAIFFLLFNLVYGLADGKVDLSAHLGGFLMGSLAGCLLARPHASGRRQLPLGRTIATGIAGAVILIAGFTALPKLNSEQAAWYRRIMTGSQVAVGNKGHVVYSGMATTTDAEKLSQGLQKIGLFKAAGYVAFLTRDPSGASIYLPLGRDESTYQPVRGKTSKLVNGQTVIIPYEDPAPPFPWTNPKVLSDLRIMGVSVAPMVGGVPIKISILSSQGELRKTIEIDQHELDFGKSDQVWFSGAATRGDAMTLGGALQECNLFRDQGARVILARGSTTGTDLSFQVKDGAWDKPAVVSGLQAITRKVSVAVGGLPITVHLLDSTFQPQKSFVVR